VKYTEITVIIWYIFSCGFVLNQKRKVLFRYLLHLLYFRYFLTSAQVFTFYILSISVIYLYLRKSRFIVHLISNAVFYVNNVGHMSVST